MNFSDEKQRAALISMTYSSSLIILKLTVGIFANSISIISEAVHSFTDLLASGVAFFSVKKSSYPPDSEHQYGHGKYEDFSGFIEGALILLSACYIIYESVKKIIYSGYGNIDTTAGIILMLVSLTANIFICRYMLRIAKKTDSIALLADAENFRTDIYTTISVLTGLVLIKFTGIEILDPIIAVLVALIVFRTGWKLCFISGGNLLDASLSEDDQKIIVNTVNKYVPREIIEVKQIKSRKSGSDKLIELVIVIPKKVTIEAGHKLCDKIEEDLQNNINNSSVIIHIEPCSIDCNKCIINEFCKD